LENTDGGGDVDINKVWENVTENVRASSSESLGCYELKQYKAWLNENCS
jgi:hypothetical protein